ncbi:MAG: NAD(P)-dependent oxidoreductase [Acidobacteriota bacterium]|nr:NAD(P)-dependent oxidoreductase [Acidobacteriota bacterium]
MKLVVLDEATFGEVSLQNLAHGFNESAFYDATRPEETAARVQGAHVVVSNKVRLDRDLMVATPTLQLICVAATGTNNVDLDAARELGIAVTNVPGYSTPSVVSHTFAMYFHLAHNNRYHQDYTTAGKWCDSPVFTHLDRPFGELAAKTWGIIGMGAIGRGVAVAVAAFGCRVIYHSTSGANLQQPWPQHDLNELLALADVVSIHAPLNARTRNLIGRDQLALMKPDAVLINVGRGGIIDEAQLAVALDEGLIAGAALDVLEREPPLPENPLFHLHHPRRLFITPHIAGLSSQARTRLAQEIRRNIDAFRSGQTRNRAELT